MDVFQFVQSFGLELDRSRIVAIGKQCYYANEDLKKIRESVNRDVFSLGTYLGAEGKYFEPSPALIDMLSKFANAEKRKIFINTKAESLFLYGRNVLIDSVARNPNNITEGLVFVQNENDENLGYGIFQTQGKDIIIKNLLDKGQYLRSEAKRK